MISTEFNAVFREIFNQLVSEGYTKRQICNLVLGNSFGPQLDKFLQGQDVGLKPLQRITSAFDCDLYLVVVPKSSNETQDIIKQVNGEFFDTCKQKLIETLSDEEKIKAAIPPDIKVSPIAQQITNSIVENL